MTTETTADASSESPWGVSTDSSCPAAGPVAGGWGAPDPVVESSGGWGALSSPAPSFSQNQSGGRPRRAMTGTPVFDERAGGYKLMVRGLTKEATQDSVREKFAEFGPVKNIYVKTDDDRPFGFVTFEDQAHAEKAGTDLNDTLVVFCHG